MKSPHGQHAGRFLTLIVMGAAGVRAPIATGEENDLSILVKTVGRDVLHGRLVSLSMKDGLTLRRDDGEDQHVPTTDLVRLSCAPIVAAGNRGDAAIHFPSGDQLFGRIIGSFEDSLWVETADWGRMLVPLDAISTLVMPTDENGARGRVDAWMRSARQSDRDQVLLRNGDVLSGFVNGLNPEALRLDVGGDESRIPLHRVAALRMVAATLPVVEPPYLVLTMRHSGRVALRDVNGTGSGLDVQPSFGGAVRIPLERVATLELVGGRWERLTGHQPISFEHTPMLQLPWTYEEDANVRGGPLTIAGTTHERGIGVHSRSRLIYDLRGEFREWESSFGIDDDSGALADVTVMIVVDDQRRFEQAHVVPGKLHGPVRLDITRAKQLELIVDFGENGDLQDRFDWIDPALIR